MIEKQKYKFKDKSIERDEKGLYYASWRQQIGGTFFIILSYCVIPLGTVRL
jgi:hypothetical protein